MPTMKTPKAKAITSAIKFIRSVLTTPDRKSRSPDSTSPGTESATWALLIRQMMFFSVSNRGSANMLSLASPPVQLQITVKA